MKNKRFMKTLITSMLAVSLFVTPVFADNGTKTVRERENNNTKATANTYDLQIPYFNGVELIGTLNDPGDKVDWYKFKTNLQGYNEVKLLFEFNGTVKSTYQVKVLDKRDNIIAWKIIEPGQNMYKDKLYLDDDEYVYVQIQLMNGDPIQPYRLGFYKEAIK
jgi:hypothetical protein